MLDRASPFRVLLTALLVAAVPLCCCSFRSWLGGLGGVGGCHAGGVALAAAAAGGQGASCCQHRHADDDAAGNAAGIDRSGSEPGGPSDLPDEPCSCGKQYTSSESKVFTVDWIAPAAAPVFVAAAYDEAIPAIGVRPVCDAAILRPQTSLLRLHCALIV